MQAIAVIGAGFGDEGKGRMTDFFSSPDSLVVRFNGGAQAGHTVVRNGKRHVFHHFGAGVLAGADTFWSRFCIVNPILFVRELDIMAEEGISPTRLFVDSSCQVTTPYDMMINEMLEESRGNGGKKHGSCGAGICETIERCITHRKLMAGELAAASLKDYVREIRDVWVPKRMDALKCKIPERFNEYLKDDGILERYLEDVELFLNSVSIVADISFSTSTYSRVIFEGAQGLMLDASYKYFPHVTRANTGITNLSLLCSEFGIEEIEVVYVMRTYMTRHGEGPFPMACTTPPYNSLVDETNVKNRFQGEMRFGFFDADELKYAIDRDFYGYCSNAKKKKCIAITCADQLKVLQCKSNELISNIDVMRLVDFAKNHFNADRLYVGFGPEGSKTFFA